MPVCARHAAVPGEDSSQPNASDDEVTDGVSFVQAAVSTVSTSGVAGYTTYRLTVSFISQEVDNVYALFGSPREDVGDFAGEPEKPMRIPGAFQAPRPFGTDLGGTNPLFWAYSPTVQFDSWLTIGIIDGDTSGALSSVGIDFSSWTETTGLTVENGALFCMDPSSGETEDPAVIGQLTVADGTPWVALVNARGKRAGYDGTGGDDWEAVGLEFTPAMATAATQQPGGGH